MAKIAQEKMMLAVRYGVLESTLPRDLCPQRTLACLNAETVLEGPIELQRVTGHAQQLLVTFGIKSKLTLQDIIVSLWGPDGLVLYHAALARAHHEICDEPHKTEALRLQWKRINSAAAAIEKILYEAAIPLKIVEWRTRLKHHRATNAPPRVRSQTSVENTGQCQRNADI